MAREIGCWLRMRLVQAGANEGDEADFYNRKNQLEIFFYIKKTTGNEAKEKINF